MTTTTETPEAAIWNWLQGTEHFKHGGWSWVSGNPYYVRCNCGEVLAMGTAPVTCPLSSVVLIEQPWFEVPLGDCVLYAGRWVLLEAMWPATDDAQWLGITVRYAGESTHHQVKAHLITVVKRYQEG